MGHIEAFAERSPVEPDAVNTVVGKSLQLPNTLYRPVNPHSLLSCDKSCVIIGKLLVLLSALLPDSFLYKLYV